MTDIDKQPKWALSILRKLSKTAYLEEIEGDLQEAFATNIKKHQPAIAKLLYILDVISFLRPSLIRNPLKRSENNYSVMFLTHFKIAGRILLKNKLFTVINVLGLAIGISAYLLIIQYVRFEMNYDKQHPRIDDLYRVTLSNNNGKNVVAANHPAVAYAMGTDFPEVESYARLVNKTVMWGTFVLSHTDDRGEVIKLNANDVTMYIGEGSLLELFDIPLIRGNPANALEEPLSLVISASMASRFFGEEDPLDKTLVVNNEQPVKVTGVFEDLPQNTHLQFDILVSFSTLGNWTNSNWIWPEFYNYVRLREGTDPQSLEAKLPDFIEKYMGEIMEEHDLQVKFSLQPVEDIHLKSDLRKEISANSSDETLYFLMIIAGFVIVIALINFVNLSTAKSVERAKEVGLKKVVGARKSTLVWQFLLESLVINFIGVIIAAIAVTLLIDPFNQLVGLKILSLGIWTDPVVWAILLAIFLSGGILVGIYPAFVLSGFRPVQVLKGKFYQSGRGVVMRKVLVVMQFAVSVALIAGTFIVYSQFTYMQQRDLGYDTRHNLVINAPMVVDSTIQNKMEVFKNELKRNADVNIITATNDIPGKRITWLNGARRIHEEKGTGAGCYLITADQDFLPTYKIKLLAGRNFTREDRTSYDNRDAENVPLHRVIINKTAAKVLGFLDAEEAVNERIIFILGTVDRLCEVIGVVEDYHQQSLQRDYEPILFFYPEHYWTMYLTVNIDTRNTQETIAAIQAQYNNFFPNDPFNYFFLDEYFNRQYQADLKFGKICLLFSGLTILIAALGLFGLGSYMALQKIKEISIRKVMGATLGQVLILIPKTLLRLVLISSLFALPVTYFVAQQWLSGYAFKIGLNPWMFILPLFMVSMVAILSVLVQSLKVALVNPADSLRNE